MPSFTSTPLYGRSSPAPTLPPYLKDLVGDPDAYSYERPQSIEDLRGIFDKAFGTVSAGIGESEIERIFTDAVRASQGMARAGEAGRRGERGGAPISTGVAQQHIARGMMPLQERMARFKLEDAFRSKEEDWKRRQALFGAASGPIRGSMRTRPSPDTMPQVKYPSQGGGLSSLFGGAGGDGGGGGGDGFWDKPFDPFGGWKDIGGRRAAIDQATDRYMKERGPGGRDIPGESPGSPWPERDEPPGGGPTGLPGTLGDLFPSPDEPPGGGPTPLPDSGDDYMAAMYDPTKRAAYLAKYGAGAQW